MQSRKKHAFSKYRLIGFSVEVIHQIGSCAIAIIGKGGNLLPFYAIYYQKQYVEVRNASKISQSFKILRRLSDAQIAFDSIELSFDELQQQINLDNFHLSKFYVKAGLDIHKSYPRRDIRNAIIQTRLPRMSHHLSLLREPLSKIIADLL